MHHITREDDHNAHMDEERSRFLDCVPITIHCEDEDEARDIAAHVTDHFDTDADPDEDPDDEADA